MASIIIATPMYGGMCHGIFMKSVVQLMFALRSNGHSVEFVDIANESLITRARNTLTELFLKTNFEYMLFIDADQGFDPGGVLRMISEDKDLIAAPVPMKAINWDRIRQASEAGIKDLENHTGVWNFNGLSAESIKTLSTTKEQILEVNQVGTGLVLIKRDVFEKMKPYVESYRYNQPNDRNIALNHGIYNFWRTGVDESGLMLSEDYNFCKLWREIGGKIFLAPYVTVTHAGTYWFR